MKICFGNNYTLHPPHFDRVVTFFFYSATTAFNLMHASWFVKNTNKMQ